MSAQDYRINAEVRRLLVSRWVDVSRVQLGTTNGVVYLMGSLDSTLEDAGRGVGEHPRRDAGAPLRAHLPSSPRAQGTSRERLLQLAMTLEKDIRRIRDVRDVVFKLDNVFKRGGRWRNVEAAS